MNPEAKAMLKAAEYVRAHEVPSDDRPFVLITGRTPYQFPPGPRPVGHLDCTTPHRSRGL